MAFEAHGAADLPTSVLMAFHLYQVEGAQDSPLGMGQAFPRVPLNYEAWLSHRGTMQSRATQLRPGKTPVWVVDCCLCSSEWSAIGYTRVWIACHLYVYLLQTQDLQEMHFPFLQTFRAHMRCAPCSAHVLASRSAALDAKDIPEAESSVVA